MRFETRLIPLRPPPVFGARRQKKVLALVLAMAMSLSLAVTAGAAFNDQDKIVNTEAVDMCAALNIINGYTDGSFKPEGNVTRAEAAKMITIALNGGKEPTLSASATPTYTDTANHWAAKYIEYCTSLGIVAGDGAGKFNPNGNVKAVELAKMLLIAIGYNAENEKFVGKNWDTNVNVVASQKDLYEELESIDPSVAATRDTAAQMVWNALKAWMVEYDYKLTTDANGNITSELKVKDDDQTLLGKKYNAAPEAGIITKVEFDAEDAEYTYTVGSGDTAEKFVTEADYSDLFGHNVTFLTKGGDNAKVYGVYDNGSEIVAAPAHAYVVADKEIDGVEYDFDNAEICYHAYNEYDSQATPAEWDMVSFVDTDGDDEIDCGIFVPTYITTVQYVGVKSFTLAAVLGNTYFDNEDNDPDCTVYEGIAEEDVVAVVKAENTIDNTNVVSKLDVVSGKVAAIKGDEAKVGETWYEVADAYAAAEEPVVALGAELDYAVVNSTIVWAEATETTIAADEYVVVTAADAQGGFNKYDRAEVLHTDGTTEILNIELGEGQSVVEDAEGYIVGGIFVLDEAEDDGVYVLNPVVTTTASGFDGGKAATVAVADEKLDSKAIAADAIVFVKDGDDYSVTTGAKLADSTASVSHYWYNTSDSTGFDTVVLAYATAGLSSTSDLMFGYVTADTIAVKNDDDKNVTQVTFWDGAEKVLMTTESEDVVLNVGQAFSYKLVDGAMDIQSVYGEGYEHAVTAWDGENMKLYGLDDTFTLEEDTVIIYVDTDKDTGVEGGKIALAGKANGVNYTDNVLVNAIDGELQFIFVDVNNEGK